MTDDVLSEISTKGARKKIDYVQYTPKSPRVSITKIKERLPARVARHLLRGTSHTDYGIYVERQDAVAQAVLDRYFKWPWRPRMRKDRYVEVNRSGISEFSYFVIHPIGFEWGSQFFTEYPEPKCSVEGCPYGRPFVGPVCIPPKRADNLGIAILETVATTSIELLVSPKLRATFEAEGVTGVTYEPCFAAAPRTRRPTSDVVAYVARVAEGGAYQADAFRAVRGGICSTHNTLIPGHYYRCSGFRLPAEEIHDLDFQYIVRLHVNGVDYCRWPPIWFVSRKVVNILLREKTRGLKLNTCFLDEKFVPFLGI